MAYKRSRQAFEADLQKQQSPYVVYGTALPPLDEHTSDDGSYVPVWKQEVTDDRGRKRLHGAFTGGFSAGYFNTVGSKEGWTPSTFVSSRAQRAQGNKGQNQQRVEDFMDEEDIREAEESRQLSTAGVFSGFGTEDDPLRKDALIDLFRPSEDSMGFKLLKRMGWKEGQGIGPRIKQKAIKDTVDTDTHLFAPDDVSTLVYAKNSACHGLGYADGTQTGSKQQTSHVPDFDHPSLMASARDRDGNWDTTVPGRKRSSKSDRAAFGVGVLNDTGSDDEDPYDMGPKISYNRVLGGDKKNKKKKSAVASSSNANPLLKAKPIFVSKKLSLIQSALRKCHDGRLPLTGFSLADELAGFPTLSLDDNTYRPPTVPKGWTPSRLAQDTSEPVPTQPIRSIDAAGVTHHDHKSRSAMLGETQLPGKSVFDFLTPAAREKLVKATGRTDLPRAMSEQMGNAASLPQKSYIDLIPYLEPGMAAQALVRMTSGGFVPYADDLAKRQRYGDFLQYSASSDTKPNTPSKPEYFSTEDWVNELSEFVRAAEVFKPVSSGLSSRFISASTSTRLVLDDDPASSGSNKDSLLRNPSSKPEDPMETAANLGMFGTMTRAVLSFTPTRLVCKRFGVAMPAPIFEQSTASPGPAGATGFLALEAKPAPQAVLSEATTNQNNSPSTHRQQNAVELDQESSPTQHVMPAVNADRNEALEQERPGMAVFKAIFGSDDSDSDDDNDDT